MQEHILAHIERDRMNNRFSCSVLVLSIWITVNLLNLSFAVMFLLKLDSFCILPQFNRVWWMLCNFRSDRRVGRATETDWDVWEIGRRCSTKIHQSTSEHRCLVQHDVTALLHFGSGRQKCSLLGGCWQQHVQTSGITCIFTRKQIDFQPDMKFGIP